MYLVDDLFREHGKSLGLEMMAGSEGLSRTIKVPEIHRPGLGLAGYLRHHVSRRILIFGKVEMEYLKDLPENLCIERLEALLKLPTPCCLVARRYRPNPELISLCNKLSVPLFRTKMTTMTLINKLSAILNEEFSPSIICHGTLVEIFGVGVLIQGASSVGKSEAALGLIERGHRLVSDDVVRIRKRENFFLEGSGAELTRYHMEIRGIGIINVANLYGAVCVRDYKNVEIVVQLEVWDDNHFYDRVGLEDQHVDILGLKIPFHTLPVKPGRDVVLLLETIALNHRLKMMGYNSAKEFNSKLLETIAKKQKKRDEKAGMFRSVRS